jgi:hypothetical protein
LLKYPGLVKGTHVVTALAHAGKVSCVRFSCDGKFPLSLGKKDRCLPVWRWLFRPRYSVHRSPNDGLPRPCPPPPPPTAAQVASGMVGATVDLHGLVQHEKLNGACSVITTVPGDKGGERRFTVRLTSKPGGGRISKREKNLVLKPRHVRKNGALEAQQGGRLCV